MLLYNDVMCPPVVGFIWSAVIVGPRSNRNYVKYTLLRPRKLPCFDGCIACVCAVLGASTRCSGRLRWGGEGGNDTIECRAVVVTAAGEEVNSTYDTYSTPAREGSAAGLETLEIIE